MTNHTKISETAKHKTGKNICMNYCKPKKKYYSCKVALNMNITI